MCIEMNPIGLTLTDLIRVPAENEARTPDLYVHMIVIPSEYKKHITEILPKNCQTGRFISAMTVRMYGNGQRQKFGNSGNWLPT